MQNKLTGILALTLITALLFMAGCMDNQHADHLPKAGDKKTAAFRAEFRASPAAVNAGTPTTLAFTIRNAQGDLVRDLQIVHEKPMHLLIVSTDLAEFYHIHPEPQSDGSLQVRHTFPYGGEYRLYADFTPAEASPTVEQITLKVTGAPRADERLITNPEMSGNAHGAVSGAVNEDVNKVVNEAANGRETMDQAGRALTREQGGLRVTLIPEGPLQAGNALMLNFKVTDAITKKPVTNLQRYLGEYAHFVIISEDLAEFLHAHPVSKAAHLDHQDAPDARPHTHDESASGAKGSNVSEVAAHTTFPKPGAYKIWAQFQREGKVITVPFVVNVGAAAGAAPSTDNHRNHAASSH